MKTETHTKALEAKLATLQERENGIARKEAEETLRDRHPDFEDIIGDDSFHSWAKEQPEAIQGWIYDNPDNVQLAVKAIDLYKMDTGIATKGKRKARVSQPTGSAADMVSTRTTNIDANEPKIWTQREINSPPPHPDPKPSLSQYFPCQINAFSSARTIARFAIMRPRWRSSTKTRSRRASWSGSLWAKRWSGTTRIW